MGGAGGAAAGGEEAPTSTVVRIGNVVTPEELTDDEAQKEVWPCSAAVAVLHLSVLHVVVSRFVMPRVRRRGVHARTRVARG